jgi:hypothetical protein
LVSYVSWVCCWFSPLLRGFFSGFSGFSPSTKINTLIRSWIEDQIGNKPLALSAILVKHSHLFYLLFTKLISIEKKKKIIVYLYRLFFVLFCVVVGLKAAVSANIVYQDNVIWEGGFGVLNKSEQPPRSPNSRTLYPCASTSKILTVCCHRNCI